MSCLTQEQEALIKGLGLDIYLSEGHGRLNACLSQLLVVTCSVSARPFSFGFTIQATEYMSIDLDHFFSFLF